ncbi:MAG: hypothetical protein LBQ43_02120 [Holosporales bacterium]|jgi:hypothetical protein|nr:hypothetical protein [Holosporales bacterium]
MKNFCKALLVAAVSFVASDQASSQQTAVRWKFWQIAEHIINNNTFNLPDEQFAYLDNQIAYVNANMQDEKKIRALIKLAHFNYPNNGVGDYIDAGFSDVNDAIRVINMLKDGSIYTFTQQCCESANIPHFPFNLAPDEACFEVMEAVVSLHASQFLPRS